MVAGCRAYEASFSSVLDEGSDEEEDLSKMDMGTKARKKIRPWHFESDEAWTRFNDQLEATPKYTLLHYIRIHNSILFSLSLSLCVCVCAPPLSDVLVSQEFCVVAYIVCVFCLHLQGCFPVWGQDGGWP